MTEVIQRAFLPIGQQRPWRLKIVNYLGGEVVELVDFVIGQVGWNLSALGFVDFTVATDEVRTLLLKPPRKEVQVWLGGECIWWGVVVRARGDSRSVTFQASSLEWYFGKRVIGKVPIPNLLLNPSFEDGERFWDFSFAEGSIPAAPPEHAISTDTLSGPRSLKLIGSSEVQITTTVTVTTLSGDVTFAFDSDELSSGGVAAVTALAQSIPAGTSVTVVGHTDSNASHAYNQDLSQRRANTVRSRMVAVNGSISVSASGKGETQPIASNDTAAGRAANRRVEISYDATTTTTVEATGHRQFARQRIRYTNPKASKKPKYLTLVAWMKIKTFDTPAKDGWALYLERLTPEGKPITGEEKFKAQNPSPTALTTTVNVLSAKGFVSISSETPTDRWLRMEATIAVPPDDKNYIIESRLYPPGGEAIFDEISLTASDSLSYTDTDQAEILKGLVEHAQDPAMGKTSLNIGTQIAATGVKRTRDWPWIERMRIYDAMQDFAVLADGMEWQVTFDGINRQVQSYFPRMGQDSSVVLALGSTIATFTVDVDGEQSANQIIVQAEGEGSDREEGYATDASALDGIVLEKVYNATPGSAVSSLDAQAQRGLKRYRNPVTIPSVTISPEHFEDLFERLKLGDRARVVVKKGWVNVDAKYRIVGITVVPQTRTLTYTLTPED